MGKLDRRLIGDTYKAACRWGFVDEQPAMIFCYPKVADAMEKAAAMDIKRGQTEDILEETSKTVAHDIVIEGAKRILRKKR